MALQKKRKSMRVVTAKATDDKITHVLQATDGTPVTPGAGFLRDKGLPAVLYVGTSGNVRVETVDGTTLDFANFPSGQTLPVLVTRVFNVGTTASDIVALF